MNTADFSGLVCKIKAGGSVVAAFDDEDLAVRCLPIIARILGRPATLFMDDDDVLIPRPLPAGVVVLSPPWPKDGKHHQTMACLP